MTEKYQALVEENKKIRKEIEASQTRLAFFKNLQIILDKMKVVMVKAKMYGKSK